MKVSAFVFAFVISFSAFAQLPQPKPTMPVYKYSNANGSRNYALYIPKGLRRIRAAVPLFVVLHGCTESSEVIAADTGMNTIADREGFVVVYPEQTSKDNPLSCWNWFTPDNLKRGAGELSIITGIMSELESKLAIDPARIYVMGLSAGAAMAANLAACYSDHIAGVAVGSGLTYASATTQQEAQQAMRVGPARSAKDLGELAAACPGREVGRPVLVVSIQGNKDKTVAPVNSDAVIASFAYMNDLLDDGKANGTQTAKVISQKEGQVSGGHKFLVQTFGNPEHPLLVRLVVDGMGHAWSGSPQASTYGDPKGPPASELIWQHFSKFHRTLRHR